MASPLLRLPLSAPRRAIGVAFAAVRWRRIGLALAAAVLLAAAPPVRDDASYVMAGPHGWTARTVLPDGRITTVERARSVRIAAVEDVPAFTVRLRPPPAAPDPADLPLDPATPLLVLADTHGEYAIAVALLQRQGVIDARLRWRFGKGRLVVLGDMFDRGAHQTELLWLFYALEAEARAAGGRVHVLLGNHEAMNLRGDLRYLHPGYPETARALGAASYAELFGRDTLLGGWLRAKPVMLKLGQTLFAHGGVSPELVESGLSIARINAASRAALDVPIADKVRLDAAQALVAGRDGPLWYRGYFGLDGKAAEASPAQVAASLKHFGVARILVGHTIVEHVEPRFGGQVIAVQVYPRRDEATGKPVLEAALRLKGKWLRASADGSRAPLDQRMRITASPCPLVLQIAGMVGHSNGRAAASAWPRQECAKGGRYP